MNYLAHIYLSGDCPAVQIGNFIGDFVKGKTYLKYPSKIRKGILLHRFIDSYTDNHALFAEAKSLLRDSFGRYAGIVLDMYYDHFLARDFERYSKHSLSRFSRIFYRSMICHYWSLPKDVRRFAWHFISSNRLCKYASLEGLQQSLEIMTHYKPLNLDATEAITFLTDHYALLHENFHAFFSDAIRETANK